MGNRANVLVKESDGDNGVCLYTHWGGSELPKDVQTALSKRVRWNDCQYTMTQNNPKTDATIEQLSEFLAKEIKSVYYVGNFDRCNDFIDEEKEELSKIIQEFLIEFTKEHPVRNTE